MKNQAVIAARFEAESSATSAIETRPSKGLPRAFDLLAAFVGLLLSAPLLLLCALAVALTSRGRVLFRQQRVGMNGENFTLYKFRTMRHSDTGPQVTSAGDPRITAAGRVLRNTKLDELPTLWNVLRGDMSLVGPRPEVPRYVRLEDPTWQAVLKSRPGITDPVTVRLRNEEALLARVAGDPGEYYMKELQPLKLKGYIAYLEKRTWRTDLKVLLQTIWSVIVPRRSEHEP